MGEMDVAGAWHADGEVLGAYSDGRLDAAGRWSVEAHLTSCAACRLQAGALVDPVRLRRLRAALIEAVDVPRAGVVERLVRLGVPDHTARVLAATPALRGSWLLAVAATLAFAVLAAWVRRGADANLWFLCIAPLLPLAGIAVAYGPGVDPTYEIGLAAPLGSFRLLLLRAATVLGTSTLLAAAASSCCRGSAGARPAGCCPRAGADGVQPGAGHDGRTVARHRGHRRRLGRRGGGERRPPIAVVGPVLHGRAGRLRHPGAAVRRRGACPPRPFRDRPRLRHPPGLPQGGDDHSCSHRPGP